MIRFLTPRRLLVLGVAALALPVALLGCSKKITSADADYTQLEGIPDADAQLMLWPDIPTEVRYFADLGSPGPSEDDTLLEVTHVYRTGPGTVQTMLMDGGLGSGFQFYRRASNGGFEPMRDYVVTAQRKWLDSHWELYELTDTRPSGFSPPTYIARGLLAGASTANSPVTNAARLTTTTSGSLVYTGLLFPARTDTAFTTSWGAIPGAAGYWIHVYQFRSDASNNERVLSGTPSPVWNGKVRDVFVGYVAAPATSYKLGEPGARILTFTPPISGQVYLVRVTAVDAFGQLLAYPTSNFEGIRFTPEGVIQGVTGSGFTFLQEEGRWKIFSLSASPVNPGGSSGVPNLVGSGPDGVPLYSGSGGGR